MSTSARGSRCGRQAALTHFAFRHYSAAMFRRFVAACFVALWFVLLGIDFLGDTGVIQEYRGSATDRAVDSVLTNYGQATNISNDAPIISPILTTQPTAFSPSLTLTVSTEWVNKPNLLSREEIPIYKFHVVFLI